MKRFYKLAATEQVENGHRVTLDGRPIRTPAKTWLVLPTAALADAITTEWNTQEEKVDPSTMPMMSLASTAIDRVLPQRDAVAREIAGFGGTDLLCYRAETPVDLSTRQAKSWQPMLDWAERRYGAKLSLSEGIVHIAQDQASLDRLATAVTSLDAFHLSALHVLTSIFGSLVLALAVNEGEITVTDAFDRSRLDEDWQAELWGVDEEAAGRRETLLSEVRGAYEFMTLLRQ